MSKAPVSSAYIVAARRTALGRIGGLHRARRLEELAAPIVQAALKDARLPPDRVNELVLGNASDGGNPARLVALAAGLPASVPAITVDRQCASGLDAILTAVRLVEAGEAGVVVAGGAESLSTAPWRIAKPRSLYQLPHFIGFAPSDAEAETDAPQMVEAAEALARRLGISRVRQDAYAVRTHLKAAAAHDARRFVSEILPLRSNPEEARDQSAVSPSAAEIERLPAYLAPGGTLTSANTASLHDGAAFAVVVSEAAWRALGQPPALRPLARASEGAAPEAETSAPMAAVAKLIKDFDRARIGTIELNETSAAQAIAFTEMLGFDEALLNPDGGAIARGHTLGAAGAVLVARLFTTLAGRAAAGGPRYGIAAVGAMGGIGLAALFEAVRRDI